MIFTKILSSTTVVINNIFEQKNQHITMISEVSG